MDQKYSNLALNFKALSDENRIRILDYLKDGECCACKILEQLQISQPTLSHHMRILSGSDLVKVRKDGKWMHYSLNEVKFLELKEQIERFTFSVKQGEETCSCR